MYLQAKRRRHIACDDPVLKGWSTSMKFLSGLVLASVLVFAVSACANDRASHAAREHGHHQRTETREDTARSEHNHVPGSRHGRREGRGRDRDETPRTDDAQSNG